MDLTARHVESVVRYDPVRFDTTQWDWLSGAKANTETELLLTGLWTYAILLPVYLMAKASSSSLVHE